VFSDVSGHPISVLFLALCVVLLLSQIYVRLGMGK
jgi:hypothetical protein